MKFAVIIKHIARDMDDCRVDIYDWPEDDFEGLEKHVQSNLFGNFEVLCITQRIAYREHPQAKTGEGE